MSFRSHYCSDHFSKRNDPTEKSDPATDAPKESSSNAMVSSSAQSAHVGVEEALQKDAESQRQQQETSVQNNAEATCSAWDTNSENLSVPSDVSTVALEVTIGTEELPTKKSESQQPEPNLQLNRSDDPPRTYRNNGILIQNPTAAMENVAQQSKPTPQHDQSPEESSFESVILAKYRQGMWPAKFDRAFTSGRGSKAKLKYEYRFYEKCQKENDEVIWLSKSFTTTEATRLANLNKNSVSTAYREISTKDKSLFRELLNHATNSDYDDLLVEIDKEVIAKKKPVKKGKKKFFPA
ncbi:hypothetical protein TKK_0002590 [Trichogramma kaykai]